MKKLTTPSVNEIKLINFNNIYGTNIKNTIF